MHETIKLGETGAERYLEAYRQTLRNLGAAGVRRVCYNFMPVLDWARTQLRAPLPGGGTALRFNAHEFAAFDVHVLRREGAEGDYSPALLDRAQAWHAAASEGDRDALLATIMAGLPGAFDRYDRRGVARDAGAVSGDRAGGVARQSCAVPAGGDPGGGGGGRAPGDPSGRSAAAFAGAAAHLHGC